MNRILLDSKLINNKFLINESGNYLICDLQSDSIFDINNSNANILCMDIKNDVKIKFNLNNSNLILNSIAKNINEDVTVLLNEGSTIKVYNSLVCDFNDNKINYNVYHNAKKTESSIYNFCVTKKEGSCSIKVVSSCKKKNSKAILNQNSKIISLNETNKNKIEPILLIDDYDAVASHCCFIGKFNSNELFYLESKGLNKKEAYKLLLTGFLIGVMDISSDEKQSLKEKYLS